jgi:hypothetical protein
MQIARNEGYVLGRKKLRSRISLLSFGLLIAVALLPFVLNQAAVFLWPLFFVVFMLTSATKQLQFDWGPGMQADQRLAQAMKGLNNRYWFGAYVPLGRQVVNHLLVGPEGVLVLETRNHPGETSCAGGRWRRKSGLFSRLFGPIPPLGNPGRDLEAAVDAVRRDLEESGLEAPVSGAVVFTAPDAVIEYDGCAVTALTLSQLESWAARRRNNPPTEAIPDAHRQQIIEHFASRMPGGTQLSAPRPKTPVR